MQAAELGAAKFRRNLIERFEFMDKNSKNIEEFNDVLNVLTPYSSTGSMNTSENSLRALVDWLSVTFNACKNWHEIAGLLGLEIEDFTVTGRGFQGYQNTAKLGHIVIAFEPPATTINMGVHLYLTGEGCRQYEAVYEKSKNVWSDLFLLINTQPHKITRLDLAIDDFHGYFTIDQLYNCAKKGNMTAKRIKKVRSYEEFFLEDGETFSRTFYVGKSDWMIRFYNKLAERKNKGFDLYDYIETWNRYELQLRNETATSAAFILANEHYELGEFIKGFFSEKIDFKVRNKNDSNKSRWESTRWWKKFLGDVEKIPLTQVAPDPSIPKIHNWLDAQVNTSLYVYLQAFDNSPIVIEFLKQRALEKFDDKKSSMVNDFKKDKKLKHEMLLYMSDYLENKKTPTLSE